MRNFRHCPRLHRNNDGSVGAAYTDVFGIGRLSFYTASSQTGLPLESGVDPAALRKSDTWPSVEKRRFYWPDRGRGPLLRHHYILAVNRLDTGVCVGLHIDIRLAR